VQNLQTTLDSKATTTQVNAKQDIINDNSLTFSKVLNLQSTLDSKAPIISPTFIGVPTAPTPARTVSTTQIATTSFVHDVVSDVIGGAPESLNTLKELSQALQNDNNYFTTINNALASKANSNNPVFTGNVTFTNAVNIPINGLEIANVSGLQTQLNDLKNNTSLLNNLADGAIPIAKVNNLGVSLDSK
jgi:hypothetical protein